MDFNEALQDRKEALSTVKEEMAARKAQVAEFDLKLRELGDELKTLSEAKTETISAQNVALKTVHSLEAEILEIEAKIAEKIFEGKVDNLLSQQKEFWAALKERLIFQLHNHQTELVGFGEQPDPDELISKVRREASRTNSFNREMVAVRGAEKTYSEVLRGLCEAKIKGTGPSAFEKQETTRVIDKLLFHPDFEKRWNR